MAKNKNIILLVLSIFMIALTFSSVNAGSLNVILQSQNPDPVSPGNFVYLNVKVSNTDSNSNEDLFVKFIENENFKLASGEKLTKNLGKLDGDTIVKYKIFVDEKTPSGLNTVTVQIQDLTYELDLLVQETSPEVYVKNIETTELKPGSNGKLSITLKNGNSINLNNVKISLDLASVEENIINLNKGSNEIIIDNMKSGDEKEFVFDIAINPSAESKPYLLPVQVSYTDNLDKKYTSTIYSSVKVYSKPYLSVNLDSQEIYTIGSGKINLAISNPGSSKIKGVQMKVLESEDYEILKGQNQYVGDLNPDDFQSLQSTLYIKNEEAATLKIEMKYFDSYESENKDIIEIPLKIYNKEELSKYGFLGTNGGSSFFTILIMFVIGGVIGYFIGKRKSKNKR